MCAIGVLATGQTVPVMTINLQAPIWDIHHVAEALLLSVDTAREHSRNPTFPRPKAGFAKNLWLREEVLAWFAALPSATETGQRRKHTPAVQPARSSRAGGPPPLPAGVKASKAYKQRPRGAAA